MPFFGRGGGSLVWIFGFLDFWIVYCVLIGVDFGSDLGSFV